MVKIIIQGNNIRVVYKIRKQYYLNNKKFNIYLNLFHINDKDFSPYKII